MRSRIGTPNNEDLSVIGSNLPSFGGIAEETEPNLIVTESSIELEEFLMTATPN